MQDEIGDQTFRFPSSELARILSPKALKAGVKVTQRFPRIENYDCKVDGEWFTNALNDVVDQLNFKPFVPSPPGSNETASYPSLAAFLTDCINACHDALDNVTRNGYQPATSDGSTVSNSLSEIRQRMVLTVQLPLSLATRSSYLWK